MTAPLTVLPVEGLPEIAPGDDLATLIAGALPLRDGDVVVVAQKVVSKAEGALVDAPAVHAGDPRREVAREQAVEVVADSPWAFIVRTRHGFVCANAGVDASNVAEGKLALLPDDPDASARRLRDRLHAIAAVDVAVIVSDTFGRPWRLGQVDVAIGVAGLAPIRDERGAADRFGRTLDVTESAVADELAGAAELVRSKASGTPVVVVRGFGWTPTEGAAARQLVRPPETDLFTRGRGMLAPALTAPDWPAAWHSGVTAADLAHALRVAPNLFVVDAGPPALLRVDDALSAGLAVAVLADLGLRVRWRRDGSDILVEAGRSYAAG